MEVLGKAPPYALPSAVLDYALKSIRPGKWPLKKTWQPLPHQTGSLSIGMSSLVNTAFETLLLKSARSKWA